jgi:23S rRNA pseudoU1915 N3-methylase RlmH
MRTYAHSGIPHSPGTWIAVFEQSGNETEAEDLAVMLLLAAVTGCMVVKGPTGLEIELLAAGDEELLLNELKLPIALEAMLGIAD